jgi:hypothetical protein
MESNLQVIYDEVSKLMSEDGYEKSTAVLTILKILLNTKEYSDMLKTQVNEIKKDNKIDTKDFPSLFVILTESKDFISDTLNDSTIVKSSINGESLKYIIYGSMYYALLETNTDKETTDMLMGMFLPLWKILKINPDKIANEAQSLFKRLQNCCDCCSCCKC